MGKIYTLGLATFAATGSFLFGYDCGCFGRIEEIQKVMRGDHIGHDTYNISPIFDVWVGKIYTLGLATFAATGSFLFGYDSGILISLPTRRSIGQTSP
jgi:hypothetical protein